MAKAKNDAKPARVAKSAQAGLWINERCTKSDLSILLGVSLRTLTDLDSKGILVRVEGTRGAYKTQESVARYIRRLIDAAAGRGGGSDNPLAQERLIRAKIGRRLEELELAKIEGEILTLSEISESWTALASRMKSTMLAFPSKARQRLPHLSAHDAQALKEIVHDALTELSREVTSTVIGGDPADIKPA